MKALFLVETGHGMGHIVRCLNLARLFEKYKIYPVFLTRGNQGIEKIVYKKEILPTEFSEEEIENKINKFKPDIFIIDILDPNFKIINSIGKKDLIKVVIFDFVSKEPISADLIINPNPNMMDYKSNVAKCLFGPKYAILGDFFRKNKKVIKKMASSVMVSMGGSDPRDYTSMAVEALKDFGFKVSVIVGALSKNKKKIEKMVLGFNNFNFKTDVSQEEICKLMVESDLLLSTAGNTMYEAATLGLPNIVFCNHNRHMEVAETFSKKGAIINLGINPKIDIIKETVEKLAFNYTLRKIMSKSAKKLVDGKGTERIVKIILRNLRNIKGKL